VNVIIQEYSGLPLNITQAKFDSYRTVATDMFYFQKSAFILRFKFGNEMKIMLFYKNSIKYESFSSKMSISFTLDHPFSQQVTFGDIFKESSNKTISLFSGEEI